LLLKKGGAPKEGLQRGKRLREKKTKRKTLACTTKEVTRDLRRREKKPWGRQKKGSSKCVLGRTLAVSNARRPQSFKKETAAANRRNYNITKKGHKSANTSAKNAWIRGE